MSNKVYRPQAGDVVSIEATLTGTFGDFFCTVSTSDGSTYRVPMKDVTVKRRRLRPGDFVRYRISPPNDNYYRGRLIVFDNGNWIIRDNSSSRTSGTLVERKAEDIWHDD